jgi:hypothetical protein
MSRKKKKGNGGLGGLRPKVRATEKQTGKSSTVTIF